MCNRLSRSTPKHPLPAGGRGSLVAGVASSRGGSRAGSSDVIPDHVISCHIIPCYIKRPQQLWRGRGFHPQPLGAVLYYFIFVCRAFACCPTACKQNYSARGHRLGLFVCLKGIHQDVSADRQLPAHVVQASCAAIRLLAKKGHVTQRLGQQRVNCCLCVFSFGF